MIGIFSSVQSSFAFNSESRADLTVFQGMREANQKGLSDVDTQLDTSLTLGWDFSLDRGSFRLEARPEVRGILGGASHLKKTDPSFLSVRSPDRFLDLRLKLGENEFQQWYGDFEKLKFSWDGTSETASYEIHVGRRVISLGVLRLFPVWNKLGRNLPTTVGPGWVFSQDGVGARVQFSSGLSDFSLQSQTVLGANQSDFISLVEATWYSEIAEMHFLISRWWDENVAGVAFARDLGGMTLRTEVLGIGWTEQIQLGLGAEYAINEKWSVIGEFLTFQNGERDYHRYSFALPTRFQPLRAAEYTAIQMNYRVSPFLTLTGGTLLNINDLSQLLSLRGEYSIGENSEVLISGFFPVGRSRTEFSANTFVFADGSELGTPSQLALLFRTYF